MILIRSFSTVTPVAVALLVTACGGAGTDVTDGGDDPQLPPPAAALSAEGNLSLESRLEQLEDDLRAVIEGGLEEESQPRLMSAEATTDRLLEDQIATDWLGTGYLVEARLRQIQALADRIVAELRRGVARELVLQDIAALRTAVHDLREQLAAQGNGKAPPSLDSLLANYANEPPIGLGGVPAASASTDTTAGPGTPGTPGPAAAPEGGPLGEPIRP